MRFTKKISILLILVLLSGTMSACGQKDSIDYTSWLPDSYQNGNSGSTTQEQSGIHSRYEGSITTDQSNATKSYSADQMISMLTEGRSEDLAEALWQEQIANGIYSVTQEELKKNMLVYYVSSSEGDDNNLGISPDSPKKSLEGLAGISNITVLLKCGDTFDMNNTFYAGSGCIYATYGVGKRPVLNFYRDIGMTFQRVTNYTNVWQADLSEIEEIVNDSESMNNCNIGQLCINGTTNWKRLYVSTSESQGFNYADALQQRADNSWSVDWINSSFYMYSESDPNNMEILIAPDRHGIYLATAENTIVKGWEITGVGAHACYINECTAVTVTNCYFHNIGGAYHRSAGVRYGNAVQVWNGGADITVSFNYADWIFDSCYTDQGSSSEAVGNNIVFQNNIGAHSFTGIETWSDIYTDKEFNHLLYAGNILYAMCDITDPDNHLYSDSNGKVITENGDETEYVSYRGGYTYNQMACLNASLSKTENGLLIQDNIFWKTNRVLLLLNNGSEGYPYLYNNLFWEWVPSGAECLYRYTDSNGKKIFSNDLMLPENYQSVYIEGTDTDCNQEYARLHAALCRVMGEE